MAHDYKHILVKKKMRQTMECKFCNKKLSTSFNLRRHIEKYYMKVESIDKITMKSNENGTNLMNDKNEITSNQNGIKETVKKPKAKILLKPCNNVISNTRLNMRRKIITNFKDIKKIVNVLEKRINRIIYIAP